LSAADPAEDRALPSRACWAALTVDSDGFRGCSRVTGHNARDTAVRTSRGQETDRSDRESGCRAASLSGPLRKACSDALALAVADGRIIQTRTDQVRTATKRRTELCLIGSGRESGCAGYPHLVESFRHAMLCASEQTRAEPLGSDISPGQKAFSLLQ